MKLYEIVEYLNRIAPPEAAEAWDNSGLMVGDMEQDIGKIYVALDASDKTIHDAVSYGADLIITHHPLIFSDIKSIRQDDYLGKRIRELIKYDISCFSMHTNFDAYGMREQAAELLGFKDPKILDVTGENAGIGFIADTEEPTTLSELAAFVKKTFDISSVRFYGADDAKAKRIAVVPGSGKSYIDLAVEKKADTLITGDIDHHNGIDAVQKGLNIIDAGHYGIEHIFVDYMVELLEKDLKDKGIEVAGEGLSEPFKTI